MLKRSICLFLSLLIAFSVITAIACRGETFTVRFHANGGTLVSGEEVQEVADASEIVPPVYEKEGYVLSFDKIIENITEDTEVYAVWTPISFKLSFNADGGVFYNRTISIALGEKLSNLPIPEKDDFRFTGWYIGEILITDGYKWDFTEDKTAIAKYVYDDGFTYTITYDLDGGVLKNPKTYYTERDETFTLPEPTKEGYDFLGWMKQGETEISKPTVITEGTTGDLKFIACYAPKNLEIRFNSDGGNEITSTMSVLFDDSIGALPVPTRNGYVFIGWFNDDKQVLNGQKWTHPNNVTLVARWVKDDGRTFSISYDLNGGELNNPKNYYTVEEGDFYLPTPSKDGFVFRGYVKEGDSEVVNPVTIKKGTTGNLKFTAVWEQFFVFRFELSRKVWRSVNGKGFYDVGYCTVNGKSYVDDITLTIGQVINLPTPKLENESDDQFSYNAERHAYMYWIIDVKEEDLNGRLLDQAGLVIYSGDVVTEELLKYANEDGVIIIRPRIRTLYAS